MATDADHTPAMRAQANPGESLVRCAQTKSAGYTAMHPPLLSLKCPFVGRFERVLVNWMITRVRNSKHLPPQVIIKISIIELTHGFHVEAVLDSKSRPVEISLLRAKSGLDNGVHFIFLF